MARLCPSCGDRAVTQPRLGLCNVCFADMQLQQSRRAANRNDQINAMQMVNAREAIRASTALGLRQAVSEHPDLRVLLDQAATILEGREDVLITQSQQPTTDAKLDAAIAAFADPLDRDEPQPDAGPIIIVHGGTE